MNKWQTSDLGLIKKRLIAGWPAKWNGRPILFVNDDGFYVHAGSSCSNFSNWRFLNENHSENLVFQDPTITLGEARARIDKDVLWLLAPNAVQRSPFKLIRIDDDYIYTEDTANPLETCSFGLDIDVKIYLFNPTCPLEDKSDDPVREYTRPEILNHQKATPLEVMANITLCIGYIYNQLDIIKAQK